MSAHFAISRTAASRVHPSRRAVWWGKATWHNSRVHSAAGKLTVAGNGHGVIVGCLQQYRKRWGFVRLAISRAAWPHALHGKQQQQQQREKSRRDQVWVFRLSVLFWSGNISRAWGTGLFVIGGVLVGMDHGFVFTMVTPVDRKYFLIELFEVCFLRPWWRSREWYK